MNLQLNGKIALVSGSTAGIGFAIAQALVNEGARVIANGRTQTPWSSASRSATSPLSARRAFCARVSWS